MDERKALDWLEPRLRAALNELDAAYEYLKGVGIPQELTMTVTGVVDTRAKLRETLDYLVLERGDVARAEAERG